MNEIATWRDDPDKTYDFLTGFAVGLKLYNTRKSLILAKKLHEGQYRKGGAPYLVHPLRVCNYLKAFEFEDDILLSAALLHDVVEDVESVRNNPQNLVNEYGISQDVLDVVRKLTKSKEIPIEVYYKGISEDWRALLIKLSDRCNNLSTLDCFTTEKMKSYIKETVDYVLPLCAYAKLHYPEYGDKITIMKYHITALCSTLEKLLSLIDKNNLQKTVEGGTENG